MNVPKSSRVSNPVVVLLIITLTVCYVARHGDAAVIGGQRGTGGSISGFEDDDGGEVVVVGNGKNAGLMDYGRNDEDDYDLIFYKDYEVDPDYNELLSNDLQEGLLQRRSRRSPKNNKNNNKDDSKKKKKKDYPWDSKAVKENPVKISYPESVKKHEVADEEPFAEDYYDDYDFEFAKASIKNGMFEEKIREMLMEVLVEGNGRMGGALLG